MVPYLAWTTKRVELLVLRQERSWELLVGGWSWVIWKLNFSNSNFEKPVQTINRAITSGEIISIRLEKKFEAIIDDLFKS